LLDEPLLAVGVALAPRVLSAAEPPQPTRAIKEPATTTVRQSRRQATPGG
jgi:hypothetical protein